MEHKTGEGHPECPERLSRTLQHLENYPWFKDLRQIQARPAELAWVETIHSPDYVQRAREACEKGLAYLDSPDVAICPKSYAVALQAVGGGLSLADALMEGEIQRGFALLRPPGHHAEKGQAMGFCLFNTVAIVARYLQQQHGLEHIAIVDWDVHHGNGTQHSFYEDPSIFYISLHQFPHYPGTGLPQEKGGGQAVGTTLNMPMRAGTEDWSYHEAFRRWIIPKLKDFHPDAILISAGFDAHECDLLGGIELTTACYGWMTKQLLLAADSCCQGRVLSFLEGGYNLEILPLCVAEHLAVMAHWHSEVGVPDVPCD